MAHAGIRDVVAETDVEGAQAQPRVLVGQITEADIRDVIARAQVHAGDGLDLAQRLEPGVGDGDTETQVDLGQRVPETALGEVSQRFIGDLLAVLKAEIDERFGAVSRRRVDAGEMADSGVGDLPARPQVQTPDLLQPPGYEEEAGVGHASAAAQIEDLQILAVRRDPAEAVVGDVFAQTQVQSLKRGQVAVEGRIERRVSEGVTPREVELLEVGDAGDQFAQGLF